MNRLILLVSFITSFFSLNAQNYHEYWLDGKLKAEGDTIGILRHGTWREYFETGTLKLTGNYWLGKKNGYWATFTRIGKVSGFYFYIDDIPGEEINFIKTITKEDLEFIINFDLELFRLLNEIYTAKINGNLMSLNHIPTIYVDLENEFKELINLELSKPEIYFRLFIFQKKWYLKHFKENYYECEVILKDLRDRVVEKITFKDGRELNRIINEYYSLKKKNKIYRQWIYMDEELTERKTFLFEDEDTYHSLMFYPDNSIKSKGNIKNNLKNGKWKYYDNKGKLVKKEHHYITSLNISFCI
ncbi:MAG: hypothetical protein ACR2GN_08355 [Bacteroidia bacterium]